ncbi:hypothetical protein D8M04_14235 [Oceanobacillus piezotolerans]|uniref:YokE-like PH domain-containing protein n=1 Tax=Oceanobacillus piezotolerans TaxID=2448030 RepID=A0A498D5L9_9BACI|nr:hypothetical protein [Oceanobacillus piezotolerans]RLL42710.1 hypothetical protein D8M04_14235 [Oceanobacillus piezotolerans]
MYLIAKQPYVKVERIVRSIEQINIEHERTMYLYNEKIVTEHREFHIKDVMDMSYRIVGGKGGLLYLHTSNGVYSYTVKSSPNRFIEEFKNHIKA